ncbi:protein UPSTREAM OF FLC-like [Cynara cardunculus var. scolymus]|uniref:SOSEKI DIX-like domain-containing protein n=1 Tax=Cynara cardunculus var. scolymus TaxID=59895 RepID=A0A124SFL4_CYNCS|nr:protein UPSTREAM OF FLC-like [Cynara cardunculus var. scolymus]KVI03586.1 Protein of unknown function DUF966 [Cynara cardunculus var. scolymus]
MEVIPKSARTPADLHHMTKKWKHLTTQRSPERTKVWIEPPPHHHRHRKVPVVYYLSRNGHLEHPHFLEVPPSSADGLYLRDVIDRLNSLRGKGMAAMYSWSSKRSYKNGFVWHDLAENDFIYPAHGQEYILKGSELFDSQGASFSSKSDEAPSSMSKKSPSSDTLKSIDEFDFPVSRSRKNQPWTAIDLHEYKVYTGESSAVRVAANASTQTDENRRRRRAMMSEVEDKRNEPYEDTESSELSRNEISPPPSDSSPETLESLMKSDDKLIVRPETNGEINPTAGNKMRASSVLMQLISCGSVSFRDCGPGAYSKHDNPEFSLGSAYESRMVTRGEGGNNSVEQGAGENRVGKKEDKEYFSGSLIETKKDEFPALKRSNSFDANG